MALKDFYRRPRRLTEHSFSYEELKTKGRGVVEGAMACDHFIAPLPEGDRVPLIDNESD
jgi:hypothetical protein